MNLLNNLINHKKYRNGKILKVAFLFILVFFIFFTPISVLAQGLEDIITSIAENNLTDIKYDFGSEDETGLDIEIHGAYGDYDNGLAGIAIIGPTDKDGIEKLLSYVDGQADYTDIQEKQLKGAEVREYKMEEGVGLGVVLSDYFITIEFYRTGNSESADINKAKNIAQKILDDLEKAGLLKDEAPNIEEDKEVSTKEQEKSADNESEEKVEEAKPLDEPVKISDINNIDGVYNSPTAPSIFKIDRSHLVVEIVNYHWNNAEGQTPGTIGLMDENGKTYGPWQAEGTPGQGGVENAYWHVYPNIVIPAGTYTIVDSSPETWAQNSASEGRGMGFVRATPNFELLESSKDESTGKMSEEAGTQNVEAAESDLNKNKGYSPAGVGSAGNIPGPSNATEAVVGVTVPGLIAVALGALSGIGGGGDFGPPISGTPLSPNNSGNPSPSSNGGPPNMDQVDNWKRRRRRKDDSGQGEMYVDTDDNFDDKDFTSTISDDEILINTEYIDEVFVEPQKEISSDPLNSFTDSLDESTEPDTADHILDEEVLDEEVLDEEVLDEEVLGEEVLDEEVLGEEVLGEEVLDEEVLGEEVLDEEVLGEEVLGEEVLGEEVLGEEVLDEEGYGPNGFDSEGYNREGYDINGYDRKGYNRSGFDSKGYDKEGYNKSGFNKDGFNREGFNEQGFNKNGWDSEGYDKNGYDVEGYNREGYNLKGYDKNGYDADGYDMKGFNEGGYDRDGYDREGFNYEGYNRSLYDPWGYDKQGYDKDGYHWSGYNAEGYDRKGRHWSDKPEIGERNSTNPFTEEPIIIPGTESARKEWSPKKPPLGEPYPKTVEKYGLKEWNDEISPTEPTEPIGSTETTETTEPADSKSEDTGVIGPEDFSNTLKNHDVGGPDESSVDLGPDDLEKPTAEDSFENTFEYKDPETGETSTYEYQPGYKGPRHGEEMTLKGKTDGRDYNLEFDAVEGKWINTESGNEFDVDKFEGWQEDLAEDKRRSAIEMEKMSKREDGASKALDKEMAKIKKREEDLNKLNKMRKVADKYNIGNKDGPGDVDKAIEDLEKSLDMGEELDQEKMDKIRRVIDNRIKGKTEADTGERWEEDIFKNLEWVKEAGEETAKEVITGEKSDGSFSWLGTGAKIMIVAGSAALTGGTSLTYVAVDGSMNIAEAIYRIKKDIDKGETGFRATSKAIGILILSEEMSYLAGGAANKIAKEVGDKFPVFTNKAADIIEDKALKISAKNQTWSKGLGLITKDSAENSLDQINKRLVDIGSEESAENIIENASKKYGLNVASSFDDVSKGGTKSFTKSVGKATSSQSDDIGKGIGKASSNTSTKTKPRAGSEVLEDSKSISNAKNNLSKEIEDFDKLPKVKQKKLIEDQAMYEKYKQQARQKTQNIIDKVKRGEKLTKEEIMDMKSDPASMRTLKRIDQTEDLGSELSNQEARKIQKKFNETMDKEIHQPSYRKVEEKLYGKYPNAKKGEIRTRTVRTPGSKVDAANINTDNDVIAERLVKGPDGPEWKEIPKKEWEDTYYESFAKESGYNLKTAKEKFPQTDWDNMDEVARNKQWAKHHEEAAMDQFEMEAGRDFSSQRSAMIDNGGRPMVEASPEEIAQGVDTVNIDGKKMRPATKYELVQKRKGILSDSEQLSMMEKYKIDDYWNSGKTPSEIMRNKTEAMEQLRKTTDLAIKVEEGYRDMGYKIADMPDNMKKAINVIKNNKLSPDSRVESLEKLGYDGLDDFVNKISSRIGAIGKASKK